MTIGNRRNIDDNMIQAQIDSNLEKELENLQKQEEYVGLLDRIQEEYKLAKDFLEPKREQWRVRLSLYNNQRRNKKDIGDPLLFTIHQTIMASLYDDKLSAEWLAREAGDEDVAELLTRVAEYDYDLMEKDEVDYDWGWNATFYGRGPLLFGGFDAKRKVPIPVNISPLVYLHDPRCISVVGRNGLGEGRFWGYETYNTSRELEALGIDTRDLYTGADLQSLLDLENQARAAAENEERIEDLEPITGENASFAILNWYTYHKGEKVRAILGNQRRKILAVFPLKQKVWPIIERSVYPISGSYWGVSIPDLCEDKQRARAIIQNLALDDVKFATYGMYLYDQDKITNKSALVKPAPNKFIPTDGDPRAAVQEMPRQQVKQDTQWMLSLMDAAAEKATGTPAIRQGATPDTSRTATENVLQSRSVDTRYSLLAKVFGWSEKRFWRQWYQLYKQYYKEGMGEKVVRIVGPLATKWRALTPENLKATIDPDVKITSKVISESERVQKFQTMSNIAQMIMTDPGANRRFLEKQMLKLAGFNQDEIALVFPPNAEELHATAENEELNQNKKATVRATDDHQMHLEIHNKAADTKAKAAHIEAHRKAMLLARARPDLLPTDAQSAGLPLQGITSEQRPQENLEQARRPSAPNLRF